LVQTETFKDDSRQSPYACLGSLAVKRVLGKDETPDSNSGLGFFFPFQGFQRLYRDPP
jgi:hypothetical protein